MNTQVNPVTNRDRIRLLLVDDDVSLLEITALLLERQSYLVTPSTKGSEALTILNNNHAVFDAVITDYCMPNINGIELAKMIKELAGNIPIILHTGKIDLVDEKQAAQAGIAEIVTKPYKIKDLDKVIKKVIKENGGNIHD